MPRFGASGGAIAAPRVSISIGGASSPKAPKGYAGGGPERSGASFSPFSRPTISSEGVGPKPFNSATNKLRISSSGTSIGPDVEKSVFSKPGQQNTYKSSFAFSEFKNKSSRISENSPRITRQLSEGNIHRHAVQEPVSIGKSAQPEVSQVIYAPFPSITPTTDFNGGSVGRLSRAELGTLLERPFDPTARRIEVIPQNARDRVRIELPRGQAEGNQVSTKKPLNPGGRASEIRAVPPEAARIVAELQNIAQRRETFAQNALKAEIQKVELQRRELVEKTTSEISINAPTGNATFNPDGRTPILHNQRDHAVSLPLPDRNPAHAEAWSDKLGKLVNARAELGLTADKTRTVSTLRDGLRQGTELVKEKEENMLRFFVVPSSPRDLPAREKVAKEGKLHRGEDANFNLWAFLSRGRLHMPVEHTSTPSHMMALPYLEELKKREKEKKAKVITSTEQKIATVLPQPEVQPDTQLLLQRGTRTETVLQPGVAIVIGSKVATATQAAQQEQTDLKTGTGVVTDGTTGELDPIKTRKSGLLAFITMFKNDLVKDVDVREKLFKFYKPAQDARKRQWRDAVRRFFFIIKPLETARVQDIVSALEAPTQETKSPLATVYGVEDGSEKYQRELLSHNEAVVTEEQANLAGDGVIDGIKPVYLNRKDPKEVDTKDVALVLDGAVVDNRDQLALVV